MQLKYVHVLSSNRWISMQKQDLNRKWILFLIKKKGGGKNRHAKFCWDQTPNVLTDLG